MIVRPIEEGDKETFLSLCEEFYSSHATEKKYDEKIARKTFDNLMKKHENAWGYFIIDKENGETSGYALITSYWCNEDGGNVIILDELYIKAEKRHKGYGRMFMEWLESEFKEKAVSIALEVLDSNTHAKELYSKLGFNKDGFEMFSKRLGR